MRVQYKTVGVNGVTVNDEGNGVVTAFVSVTGLVDNVKDNIHPGAYTETLKKRMPKGVWSHDWNQPTAKTLEATELKPGDGNLPSKLSNGENWPAEAGALRIKMQFNTKTRRGRDAYEDVKFFGDQQEWSIGYRVPDNGFWMDQKTGVRHIESVDLFEFSPVLFGAMSHCRTEPGKSEIATAQLQFKSLYEHADTSSIEDFWTRLAEFKTAAGMDDIEFKDESDVAFDGDNVDVDEFEAEFEEDDYADDDEGEDDEDAGDEDDLEIDDELAEETDDALAGIKSLDPDQIRTGIKVLQDVLQALGGDLEFADFMPDQKALQVGDTAFVEAKATQYGTVTEAVDAVDLPLEDKADAALLREAAQAFDDAVAGGDQTGAEEAATQILDIVEGISDAEGSDNGEGSVDSVRVISRVVVDRLEDMMDNGADEASEGEVDNTGQETVATVGGKFTNDAGVEFKSVKLGTRVYGMPRASDGTEVKGRAKRRAYIGCLGDDELMALDGFLEDVLGENGMKADVQDEIDLREYTGGIELKRVVRTAAGVRRHKSPIGSPIGHSGDAARTGGHIYGGLMRSNGGSHKAKVGKLGDGDLQKLRTHHASVGKAKMPKADRSKHESLGNVVKLELQRRKKAVFRQGSDTGGRVRRQGSTSGTGGRKNSVHGTETKLNRGKGSGNPYNADQMAALGAKGAAFKNAAGDWAYPTPNLAFLDKATTAWGRSAAEDRDSLKAYLKKRASVLNAPQSLVDRINNLSAGTTSGKSGDDGGTETKTMINMTELGSFAALVADLD